MGHARPPALRRAVARDRRRARRRRARAGCRCGGRARARTGAGPMIDRIRRDPGLALLVLALVLAAALYAPTLGRGIIDYDDPWLVKNNWLVQHPSLHS